MLIIFICNLSGILICSQVYWSAIKSTNLPNLSCFPSQFCWLKAWQDLESTQTWHIESTLHIWEYVYYITLSTTDIECFHNSSLLSGIFFGAWRSIILLWKTTVMLAILSKSLTHMFLELCQCISSPGLPCLLHPSTLAEVNFCWQKSGRSPQMIFHPNMVLLGTLW